MGFTYVGRARPSYDRLPINRFKSDKVYKGENHRSSDEIVTFINQFHTSIKQQSIKGKDPQSKVVFVDSSDIRKMIVLYQRLCLDITYEHLPLHFYLSHENKTYEPFIDLGLSPLAINKPSFKTTLEASLELITNIVGLTKKELGERYNLEPIEIRKKANYLLKAIKEERVSDNNDLIHFIAEDLGFEPRVIEETIGSELLHSLILVMVRTINVSTNHQFSSVHRAKGLEADTVLVIAKTNKELTNWLTIDPEVRQADKNDSCRLGFVAFSRAKTLLCIGCSENLCDENRATLSQRSVLILPAE